MNTHVKIPQGEPADLSRRSFLVGTAAAGLTLGYSGVPGLLGADQALAAPSSFDPSVWYSIAPDGIVTVTCGKADMGQHIASTMAQIICEELGASWKDMRVQLASNDPKFNDPVLGAQITGGSWSTMMNFDAMSRALSLGLAHPLRIVAPFSTMHKEDVIRLGRELGVPLELTLSCMNPQSGDAPCGKCSKCRERDQAFSSS